MNRGQSGRVQATGRTILLLKKANSVENPALEHESQLSFQVSSGHAVSVEHYSSASLPADLHEWAFALVRDSLKELYIPVWGWKDEDKRKQLKAASSRFLVAWASPSPQGAPAGGIPADHEGPAATSSTQDDRQQQRDSDQPIETPLSTADAQPLAAASTQPAQPEPAGGGKAPQSQVTNSAEASGLTAPGPQVGSPGQTVVDAAGRVAAAYLNYRFEQGYNKEPVLYVYEVMVSPGWQRLGLASRLMKLAEDMAWEAGMDRVVLTVLLANEAAEGLYRALSYTEDKASPHASKGYHILSRGPPKEPSSASKKKKK